MHYCMQLQFEIRFCSAVSCVQRQSDRSLSIFICARTRCRNSKPIDRAELCRAVADAAACSQELDRPIPSVQSACAGIVNRA